MEEEISKRIKAWRLERELTLKDLSEKTGLSTSFLSQVERGNSSISITSLKKIADAVEVPITSFFDEFANQSYIVKAENQKPFQLEGSGVIYTRLAGEFVNRVIEPLLLILPPGQPIEKAMTHSGEEFYYVLEGTVHFDIDGEKYEVNAGDSIHFPSTTSHFFTNQQDYNAKVLCFVTPVIF